MIDLLKLEAFLHAAEQLSFTEAAKRLHLTQPTVSHHIKLLEKEMGVKLFDRSGASLRLTEAGRALVPWARKLIHQCHDMQAMMESLQVGEGGQLNIACSTTAGKYILPQLAARFRRRYPGISVSILSCTGADIGLKLLDDEAHLGVVSREICNAEVECQPFFTDVITLIVPSNHRWAQRLSIEPEELTEEPLIIREATSGTRRVMLEELAKHDIGLDDLNVFLELGNAEATVHTVAQGYGVSFVSTVAAECFIKQGRIAALPVNNLSLRRRISMVRKSLDAPYRPQEAFWSFIHDPSNADLLQMPD